MGDGRRRGLTLVEVMVAGMLLLMTVSLFVASYAGFKQKLAASSYRYVAINLLRDCLEYFEQSDNPQHSLSFATYKYQGGAGYGPLWGPFAFIGDIKARDMVPRDYPDDVEINCRINDYGGSVGTVAMPLLVAEAQISWKEKVSDQTKPVVREETLSVIPLHWYNDQLRLTTGKFWWN
ncbi:MAG: prepilin-type N-terminal cleavage/methylation domain-containing protein [Candidatus Omnitrophota bacterium]